MSLVSLFFGQAEINWQEYWQDPVLELRLIRVLAAGTVGASLALAGLLFQAVLRNALAEPFTLGVSGGASVGAALAIIFNMQLWSVYAVPGMALAGALIMITLVLLLSAGRSVENMLLSGVIAGTASSSILMYLVSSADRDALAGLTWWMLGDLQAVDTVLLYPAVAATLLIAVFLRTSAWRLNALALGDENAWSLGVPPRQYTVLFIVIGSILAAQTVVLAGLIAFAGLIVPHLVRKFYGSDHRKNLLPTLCWGGTFLITCDMFSRVIGREHELPIGVLTAAVGGGMFIYVLNKSRRRYL